MLRKYKLRLRCIGQERNKGQRERAIHSKNTKQDMDRDAAFLGHLRFRALRTGQFLGPIGAGWN